MLHDTVVQPFSLAVPNIVPSKDFNQVSQIKMSVALQHKFT